MKNYCEIKIDDPKILTEAIQLATAFHSGQKDKGGMPYILHPLRVMLRMPYDNVLLQSVAVMHDLIEDTPVSYMDLATKFGTIIADVVNRLSRKKDESYFEYIARVSECPLARIVKIADLQDNLDHSRPGAQEILTSSMVTKYSKALAILMDKEIDDLLMREFLNTDIS